ncbi:hypothetical protein EJB05_14981, partial [Eragrostis curvula]
MAAEAPPLMDDLVEEILLRFPPDDPGSLLNAALVCKTWCRVVSGPGFNRRFREFHHRRRASPPPVLGFFCGICKPSDTFSDPGETGFMPLTPSFRRLPRAFSPSWRPVDARHGRVLFYDKHDVVVVKPKSVRLHLIVWDPITTGEVWRLPLVPMSTPMDRLARREGWSAALLCNHHVDSAFRVVVVATEEGLTSACVYSSEQHAWGVPISAQLHPFLRLIRGRNALIGNALYFKCEKSKILEYDMSKQHARLSLISQPPESQRRCIALMTADDGGLGFAVVLKSELYTWSRDGDGRWAQQRVYSLNNLLPSSQLSQDSRRKARARVVAAENACSVVFISTCIGLFIIDLKFGRVRKIHEFSHDRDILAIVPYASFCTPGTCLIPHETKCN